MDTVAMSYTGTGEEGGSIAVRASITVDGDNLSADYTLEFVARERRAVSPVPAR